MSKVAIWLIKGYRLLISPLLGNCCRFYPSCSVYCIGVIERYGFWKGIYLGICRILKCHPFHPGGVDPVPLRRLENN